MWRLRIERAGAEILAELSSAPLTHGFCHGDAWLGNVRFEGRRTTFFDFDDCCHGPLLVDVARVLGVVWDDQPADFAGLARGIVDAYGRFSRIDPGEVWAIPPLARLREIATIGFLARYCTLDDTGWSFARELCAQRLEEWASEGKASRDMRMGVRHAQSDADAG